jgi:hypothetical protein
MAGQVFVFLMCQAVKRDIRGVMRDTRCFRHEAILRGRSNGAALLIVCGQLDRRVQPVSVPQLVLDEHWLRWLHTEEVLVTRGERVAATLHMLSQCRV